MFYYILIGIAGLIALYISFTIKSLSVRIITHIQVFAIALTLTGIDNLFNAGMFIYDFSLLLIILYGLTRKEFTVAKRIALTIPVFLIFLTHTFQILHLPGAGWLGLSMVIPLIMYPLILIQRRSGYKNELGFLVVIFTDALIKLMERMEKLLTL